MSMSDLLSFGPGLLTLQLSPLPQALGPCRNADAAFLTQNRTLAGWVQFLGRAEQTAGTGSEGWGQLDMKPLEEGLSLAPAP